MDIKNLVLDVDPSLREDLLIHVKFLHDYVYRRLPDCIAKKFALDDLDNVGSYFLDYLKPLK